MAKRTHTKSVTKPVTKSVKQDEEVKSEVVAESLPSPWMRFYVYLAPVWWILFLGFFFSFNLPNETNHTSRLDIIRILPDLLLENVAPVKLEGAAPYGIAYLPQRAGFVAVMFFVLAGAWGLGHTILRMFQINHSQAPRTDEFERTTIAFGLGLSGFSLITLLFGLAGWLSQVLLGAMVVLFFGVELFARVREYRAKTNAPWAEVVPTGQIEAWKLVGFVILFLFLLPMFLGAMLPSIDFDVREYHLQGPKEFFQNGQITMLPHNMYTSFPFLTEMLTLLGMVLYGDWYWGALAGKAILMTFAPLTAMALYCMVRRHYNETAGWFAALIYLTTPWAYRISIIAYTEGALCFYVATTLFALMLAVELYRKGEPNRAYFFITGLLAGSGIATKYPGLISVAIPLCGFACIVPLLFRSPDASVKKWSAVLKITAICSAGVLVTFGPWMAKNVFETGNPVYPLVYDLFGGADWGPVLNAKFKAGHRPDSFAFSKLIESVVDVSMRNDWTSPLLFGFAPFACFGLGFCEQGKLGFGKRRAWLVALYLFWLFITWWILTHRIDRFWVPLIPVAAFLAAIGLDGVLQYAKKMRFYRPVAIAMGIPIVFVIVYNLAFITSSACGYNQYTIELNEARKRTEVDTVAFLNSRMKNKHDENVFCVGEAQVFDATYPVIYNTVFDYNLFERWCSVEEENVPADLWEMKPTAEIQKRFEENRVAYLLVNWNEVLRYRQTYGYTKFVTSKRFQWLQEQGVIGKPLPHRRFYKPWRSMSENEQKQVLTWAPNLIVTIQGEQYFVTAQFFPVIKSALKVDQKTGGKK